MPRLSILIPFAGDVEPFESTLASVLQNRPADCEVLVAHAGDYSDPYQLGDEVAFVKAEGSSNQLQLLNAAIAQAEGEVLHVLLGGAEVAEGWSEAPLAHFDDDEVALVAPLLISANSPTRIAARGVNYGKSGTRKLSGAGARISDRSLNNVTVLGPTLHAGFIRASAIQSLGGFDESMGDQFADIDLALSLNYLGFEAVFEPQSRISIQPSVLCSPATFATGRRAERLFWRNRLQRSGWLGTLLHPVVAMTQAASCLPKWNSISQLLGRAIGCLEFGTAARYQAKIRDAAETLDDATSDVLALPDRTTRSSAASSAHRRAA